MAIAPSTARAVAYTYTGTLSNTDPTFNRPLTTTSLSAVGTAVFYDVQPFFLSLAGSVTISVDSATFTPTPADDSFLCLYQGSFNPASPLTNLIAVDDDGGPGALSLITINLAALTNYFVVTTSFSNGVTGPYSDSITPANSAAIVTPVAVPEPSTITALIMGLGILGGFLARKHPVRA